MNEEYFILWKYKNVFIHSSIDVALFSDFSCFEESSYEPHG